MSNEKVRIQVKTSVDPEIWSDVGSGLIGVPVPVELETGDIQIGAIEIKDGTTDQRAIVNGFGYLMVDGSGVTQPISYSDLVKNEDDHHTSGDKGVMSLAVRNDAVAGLSSHDFDYTPIGVTAYGAVYIHDAGASITIDATALPLPTGAATSANQTTIINSLNAINSFTPSTYDSITLSYTGSNLTGVVFKLAAVTISTLTLAYDGSDNLITVTKT
jgi:hypothetical protein